MQHDPTCRRCPRLAAHLDAVRECHPDYHAAPVPSFGDRRARLLIVGLAPGLRGANRFGRPFTGDASARTLMPALARAGFANQSHSSDAGDGLHLRACRIVNAVKCLPPGNKPTTEEVRTCNAYLATELAEFLPRQPTRARCLLALGHIAHQAVLIALGRRGPAFEHGAMHAIAPHVVLADCYHPSQQNVNTGRLTPAMLDAVLERINTTLL